VLEALPDVRAANRQQVEAAIRLARTYEDLVVAISAGNETQVSWSAHRFPAAQLIRDIRTLRAGTRQPVTTADDYNFWNKPESRAVAAEIDFITMHAHPLWNGKLLGDALAWTQATYESIRTAHPGVTVVLGETGWATRRHDQGEQARLIRGEASERSQREFHAAVTAWARQSRVTTFFFEAFDENWKGGDHPDEVEKHWGLFRADRTPKPAMAGGR
jgi:exo-beta-1,3-glucanase (GH17 family)